MAAATPFEKAKKRYVENVVAEEASRPRRLRAEGYATQNRLCGQR